MVLVFHPGISPHLRFPNWSKPSIQWIFQTLCLFEARLSFMSQLFWWPGVTGRFRFLPGICNQVIFSTKGIWYLWFIPQCLTNSNEFTKLDGDCRFLWAWWRFLSPPLLPAWCHRWWRLATWSLWPGERLHTWYQPSIHLPPQAIWPRLSERPP